MYAKINPKSNMRRVGNSSATKTAKRSPNGTQMEPKWDPGGLQGSSPGAPERSRGIPERSPGAPERSPGAPDCSPEAPEASQGRPRAPKSEKIQNIMKI